MIRFDTSFVFAIAWMGRDFGPMLRAERRAREATPPPAGKEMPENPARAGSIWSVILPVLTLILYVFVDFYMDGMQKAAAAGAETEGFSLAGISAAFSYADTVLILMRASILASFIAVPLSCLTGGRGAAQAVTQNEYVADAAIREMDLGKGRGPMNHLFDLKSNYIEEENA